MAPGAVAPGGRRRWRWAVGLTLAVALVAALVVGIVRVNRAWPQARITEAAVGESLAAGGVTWTVERSRWVPGPDLPALLPGYKFDAKDFQNGPLPLAEQAMVVVDLTLRNEGASSVTVDLTAWSLESGAWQTAFELFAWRSLKPGQTPQVTVAAGSSTTVPLVFMLYSTSFKPGQWASAPSRDYRLVQLDYPDKWILDVSLKGGG